MFQELVYLTALGTMQTAYLYLVDLISRISIA